MVRISSGRLKGRRIVTSKKIFVSPEGDELRPTSAKVREAIFNILQTEIENAVFLDLYAGTGAVGLEALSRGAEKVLFIESNRVRSKAIMEYLQRLNLDDRAVVYQENAEAFLQRAMRTGLKFDIIFADPPYVSEEMAKALPFIGENTLLRDGGRILVEHSSKSVFPDCIQNMELVKHYKYGDTMLTLYRKDE
jgi:16S rRNA (guanine966-N2)-methyltransferase